MVVISYDLYAKARRSLRRIERPRSGCLRSRCTEMFPVVAAHIRVDIEFSSTIWERAFEWLIARVRVHVNGKAAGTIEAFGAMRASMSSPAVRLLVGRDWGEAVVCAEVTL
jgi:hypothetical protein